MVKESTRPSSNILPAKKIVVIEPTKLSSKNSLIQIATEKSIPEIGKIIAIGEGKLPVKMKIGDLIAYRKYGENKFYIDGKSTLFISFQDVLGVIK